MERKDNDPDRYLVCSDDPLVRLASLNGKLEGEVTKTRVFHLPKLSRRKPGKDYDPDAHYLRDR